MAKAHQPLSVAALIKLDAICDRFEAEWNAGKKPAIENQLGSVTGAERAELLRLLLRLQPGMPAGYEARIDSGSHPNKTGTLYVLDGSGKSATPGIKDVLALPDTWFTQEVIAQGNRLVIKVNGKPVTEYVDKANRHSAGHLALQVFDPQTVVEFRQVKIKELKGTATTLPAGFTPIFNGQNLAGWTAFDRDGNTLPAEASPWKADGGHLVFSFLEERNEQTSIIHAGQFADFRVRFDFQLDDKTKAGVRIRGAMGKSKEVGSGMVRIGNIFPNLRTGYFQWSTGAKDPVVPNPQPELRPIGAWNEMEIDAKGQPQRVWINGIQILDFDREEISKRPLAVPALDRAEGSIVFLGNTGTLRLRNIGVRAH
jgi:hypothetical protein